MTDRTFDVKLMPEFDGSVTGQALTEWIEKAELACNQCEIKTVKHVFPLRLTRVRWFAFAV